MEYKRLHVKMDQRRVKVIMVLTWILTPCQILECVTIMVNSYMFIPPTTFPLFDIGRTLYICMSDLPFWKVFS